MTTTPQPQNYTLPGTSIQLNRMGYGAMQLAGPHVFGPPKDEAAAIAVLRAAVELGVNHIDTSDFYGPFVTNQIIKKALHPYPRGLTLVTKVGAKRGPDGSWNFALGKQDLIDAVHSNLRNLGLSTVNAAQVAEARKLAPVVCVQNLYNVANRQDDALIRELAAQGIAYVPYFPLGGFTPLQSSTLDAIAVSIGKRPMQVALAWLLQRSPNILLIPGTSSVKHLRENVEAKDVQLTPEMVVQLDAIAGA